jgi:ABC-type phosphate transport system permease subunit
MNDSKDNQPNIREDIAEIKTEIVHLKEGQEQIKNLVSQQYVTQQEFTPVKLIVYGMVGIILITVLTSIIALVLHNVK